MTIPPPPSRNLSSIYDFFFRNLQFALSLWPANSSKTHPCLRKCVQLPHPWGKRESFIPLNLEKIKIWKNLKKNKILSNLKSYSFGTSQSRPSSWQSFGKSYFSILHRYSWYQKANLKISLRSTQEAQEISLQGLQAPGLDRTYQCRSRMWLVLSETAKNTHRSIRQVWPL